MVGVLGLVEIQQPVTPKVHCVSRFKPMDHSIDEDDLQFQKFHFPVEINKKCIV